MLLDSHGVVGSSFRGSVIDDDHAFLPSDASNASDDSSSGNVLARIHLMRCQSGKLEEW